MTRTGGCHCGKFKYEVETDLARVIECNCSHCAMRGLLLTFVTPDQFKLVSGDEAELTDYRFNKRRIAHLSCPACGVESFARGTRPDGKPMIAINVRCLEGVDVQSLGRTPFDGKSL